jgi:predicted transcriptional regulator of viral defense system
MISEKLRDRAERIFKKHGGMLRTSAAQKAGIHPRTLYIMRDEGMILELDRGLFRLASLPDMGNPDLATVAARLPRAVICLISALSFHGITTQIPHQVDIALPRGSKNPRLEFPPVRIFRFSPSAFRTGIETHRIDGARVRIYAPARTVVDCFRLRKRLGVDIAVEALRLALQRRQATVAEILRYARMLRMERVMMPYLEAMQ